MRPELPQPRLGEGAGNRGICAVVICGAPLDDLHAVHAVKRRHLGNIDHHRRLARPLEPGPEGRAPQVVVADSDQRVGGIPHLQPEVAGVLTGIAPSGKRRPDGGLQHSRRCIQLAMRRGREQGGERRQQPLRGPTFDQHDVCSIQAQENHRRAITVSHDPSPSAIRRLG
jgi:hypothetical protein